MYAAVLMVIQHIYSPDFPTGMHARVHHFEIFRSDVKILGPPQLPGFL